MFKPRYGFMRKCAFSYTRDRTTPIENLYTTPTAGTYLKVYSGVRGDDCSVTRAYMKEAPGGTPTPQKKKLK